MKMLQSTSMLDGGNIVYLETQYENYLRDPNTVSEAWREYFEQLPMVNGQAHDIPHSEVRNHFYNTARRSAARTGPVGDGSAEHSRKQIQVGGLIDAYRTRGHQLADIDPLGEMNKLTIREVQLHECGLSNVDLQTEFQTPSLHGINNAKLSEIIAHLEKIYCGSIGYEYICLLYTSPSPRD